MTYLLMDFVRKRNEDCVVLVAPLDVQLDKDNHTMVQPDGKIPVSIFQGECIVDFAAIWERLELPEES